MYKYSKFPIFLMIIVCFDWSYSQEQHPELSNLVRAWAGKLGGELWHFGEMVTRRNQVIESFKEATVKQESSSEAILKEIHEDISAMMKQKVEAVKRIMDIAEQAAQAQKDEDIDYHFQFINAKNLTNITAPNTSASTQEDENGGPEAQEVRYDESRMNADRYRAMIQPGENGYQQDEDPQQDSTENEPKSDDLINDFEVTDEPEKDPQASQTPPKDKTQLHLRNNKNFYDMAVNTNHSAVHVPSNVYDRSKDVISGIIWSEKLDETFRDNYKSDPTLSWQYFGSSTGFMRQFPAMIWSQKPIDLFDCRTRSWFIEAASSPKDVIILVDRSGSMTGMRREIARHVVHNILDTLGNNDYVNIFTFSNTTEPLVECFDHQLVQANLANVRIFKGSMTGFKTEQIANFSLALTVAFELLEEYRIEKKGANCNQAIMLVTDGVQYNFKEVFEKYNWGNLPFMNVRVFTYLIGREVSDVREVKWMACANLGYYVHLSTYAEVREEVLHYIPVMARPMVLNANQKPNPTWSPVYADVTDPKLTNWLWENRDRHNQKERIRAYQRNKTFISPDVQDKRFVHQQKHQQDNYGDLQPYHLMTSVSLPVYDKKPRQERVANLLGVAGTDIPVEYIQRLMKPYRLGVNGYAFIVTNNGYILTHPDLRPVFQGILKPAYNRVDVSEIEILDDDAEPRDFGPEIMELRRKIVMQETGNATLRIKSHIDDMRRIVLSKRHYSYKGIEGTPFTLVIALPDKYGFNRIEYPVRADIHRTVVQLDNDKLIDAFTGNWTIHPEWHYCRDTDDTHDYESIEDEFITFLKKIVEPGWKWAPCDRKLVNAVVYDARATTWFSQNITTNTKEEAGSELIRRRGITVAFLATHTGLTRWQAFPQNIVSSQQEPQFHILHNKAIDEVWYKRAVDYYYRDTSTFVYSVPFDVGDENNSLVTVSHAIFKEDKSTNKRAPATVVGYQFYHSALTSFFKNITNSCAGNVPCKRTCMSEELHCLMLDDNGYVIVSDNPQETGYFFGRIRPDIMKDLVDEKIYKSIRMYDYQGLCPEGQETTNVAHRFLTPFNVIFNIFNWALTTLVYMVGSVVGRERTAFLYSEPEIVDEERQPHMEPQAPTEEAETSDQPTRNEKEFDLRLLIPKTKPEPCDNEMYLYTLVHYTERNISSSGYNKTMTDCTTGTRPFMVQRVTGSNMIFLVINNLCREDENKEPDWPDPVQIDYNMSLACYRAKNENFPRKLYMSCINRSANESEIKLCGSGTKLSSQHVMPLLSILALFVFM